MSETYQFKLPLLQAAQAQKHVTVNEALAKMDALAQLRVQSRVLDVPGAAVDGQSYIVPVGATGAWAGQDDKIALYLNGGWEFVAAFDGWSAWVIDEAAWVRFKAGIWDYAVLSVDPAKASAGMVDMEFDHVITAGTTNQTSVVIPDHSSVVGITARVINDIVFSGATTFKVGVAGADNRYGTGFDFGKTRLFSGLQGNL
ncbi:MAG: DUF2793 domain-containing protein [Rhodobacterales bacterium]